MPIARFQMPDGRIARFEVPEGTTPEQAQSQIAAMMTPDKFAAIKSEGQAVKPVEQFRPSGEKDISFGNPDMQQAHPLVRFAKGAAAPVLGAAQLAANAAQVGGPINERLAETNAMTQRGRAEGGSEGIDWWSAGGQVLSPAYLAATRALTATSVPGRAAQGAGFGAAAGAAEPVTGGDYWAQKGAQTGGGALVGAVLPPAFDAAIAAAKGVRNVVQPFMGPAGADQAAGRLVNSAVGTRREAIIKALKDAEEAATSGQAAVGANSAEFQALQQIAAQRDPSKYFGAAGIEGAQNKARLEAVRSVGGTEKSLQNAIDNRAGRAAKNYEEAFKETVRADEVFNKLIERPSMSKVIARADDLAKEKGKAFKVGEDQYPVESLHYVKMAMDDLLKNPERFGIGSAEARAIGGTKTQFVEWLGSKSKAYDTARQQFAADSAPINRMEIGQYLEKKLVPAIGQDVEGAKQAAATFSQALRDAPATIKRATGNPRFQHLSEVLTEKELATLMKVREGLATDAASQALGRAGMPAALRKVNMAMPEMAPTGMFNPKISFARGVYNRVTGQATEKILDDLARHMDSPKEVARIMENASTGQRQSIADLLEKINTIRSPSP